MGKKPLKVLPKEALWNGEYTKLEGIAFCPETLNIEVSAWSETWSGCPQEKRVAIRALPFYFSDVNCGVVKVKSAWIPFRYVSAHEAVLSDTPNGQIVYGRRGPIDNGKIKWGATDSLSVNASGELWWGLVGGENLCKYEKR